LEIADAISKVAADKEKLAHKFHVSGRELLAGK